MKISIGPYINRWTTTRAERKYIELRYPDKPHWDVDLEEGDSLDRAVEKFLDKWQHLLNATINRILDKRERKVKVHIDGYDVWGMDTTLAYIILPMLKKLRETKHGSPYVDSKDVPAKLRPKEKPSDKNGYVDPTHHERWEWVLDEMIWAFEQIHDDNDWENQYHHNSDNHEMYFEKLAADSEYKGYSELKFRDKDPNAPKYWYDKKGADEHRKRIQNGLILFGKYYQALWD